MGILLRQSVDEVPNDCMLAGWFAGLLACWLPCQRTVEANKKVLEKQLRGVHHSMYDVLLLDHHHHLNFARAYIPSVSFVINKSDEQHPIRRSFALF